MARLLLVVILAAAVIVRSCCASSDRLAGRAVCEFVARDPQAKEAQNRLHNALWPMDPVLVKSRQCLDLHPDNGDYRPLHIPYWPARLRCGCIPTQCVDNYDGLVVQVERSVLGLPAGHTAAAPPCDCERPSLSAMLHQDGPAVMAQLDFLGRYIGWLARHQADDVAGVLGNGLRHNL